MFGPRARQGVRERGAGRGTRGAGRGAMSEPTTLNPQPSTVNRQPAATLYPHQPSTRETVASRGAAGLESYWNANGANGERIQHNTIDENRRDRFVTRRGWIRLVLGIIRVSRTLYSPGGVG